MDKVRYYAKEAWAFCVTNWAIVAGAIGVLALAALGGKRFSGKIKQIKRNTNAKVSKEKAVHRMAVEAAQEKVRAAVIAGKLSVHHVQEAHEAQTKVAKMKLRDQPNMSKEELIRFMNDE